MSSCEHMYLLRTYFYPPFYSFSGQFSDSLKMMERELFTYSFTHPSRLKGAIAEQIVCAS